MQTSNLQKLDWYISTKHIYVSDEYNIWKSPLGNYKKKHKKNKERILRKVEENAFWSLYCSKVHQ